MSQKRVAKMLPASCRQLQAGSLCSPQVTALSDIYEPNRRRTSVTVSPADSFFAYSFCVAVCSGRARGSSERLAVVKNSGSGCHLYGACPHGGDAFQPAGGL